MKVCVACGAGPCDETWTCRACGHRPATLEGFTAFAPDIALNADGFHEEFFGALADLETDSFWFRARNDLIVWALRRYAPAARSFFEIGCGTGFVLAGIRAQGGLTDLSGSEIFSRGLAIAAERVPAAALYQMDARTIPFREEFDVIGAFDVLEHIEEDERVMHEVHKALRPRGVFLMTVPQHPSLWSLQDEHARHVRRYTAAGLTRKIEAAGFEVVRRTSFVSLLLPALVASRLAMRLRARNESLAAEFDAMDALRQPTSIGRILSTVMKVEGMLTRRGVSFPAGGSLLLVAKKSGEVGPT